MLVCFFLYNENTWLKTTEYFLETNTSGFEGFKIAHVSDLHNTSSKRLKKAIIREIKKASPDIIAITGDLIDSSRTDVDSAIEFIEDIKEIAPIYYVTGNHEGATKEYKELKERLEENNVIVLEGNHETLQKGSFKIEILGVSDPNFLFGKNNTDKIKKELSKIDFDKASYSILLAHRPDFLDTYSEFKVNLVLCGHAHGGQIKIPFIGPLYAPGQGWFPAMTSGIYDKDDTSMIISRGIGNSNFPFRINNRPELIIINLQ